MNILFADKFPEAQLALLESQQHACRLQPELSADELPDAIGDADVLVVRSTKVNGTTLRSGSNLKMVIRAGAGTNTIDKSTAASRDIPVCNVPGKNALAVAELAFGLLICIDRNIPCGVQDLNTGVWNKKRYSKSQGIFGRRLGIVGVGDIGLAMAERAHAFGMHVNVVTSSSRKPAVQERLDALGATTHDSLESMAEACDVMSFHVPGNADTQNMINAELLAHFQDDAILLNTSRGEIVDEAALIAAMENKGIRAGLDVYQNEPTGAQSDFSCGLARHPNVYGTHHIGASTEQAQNAVADEVVNMINALQSGDIRNCVNL